MNEETSSVVLLPEVKVEPYETSENHADSEESSLESPTDENSLPRFGETSEEDIQRLLERQVQNAGHRSGHRSQGTGHRSQGTGYRSQGTGYRAQGTGHRAQVTGHRS